MWVKLSIIKDQERIGEIVTNFVIILLMFIQFTSKLLALWILRREQMIVLKKVVHVTKYISFYLIRAIQLHPESFIAAIWCWIPSDQKGRAKADTGQAKRLFPFMEKWLHICPHPMSRR